MLVFLCVLLFCAWIQLLLLLECLMKRLKDTDTDVRLAALTALSSILLENPIKLTCETVHLMFDRVKDRNFEIRKLASETAGKGYYKHIASVYIQSYVQAAATTSTTFSTALAKGTSNTTMSLDYLVEHPSRRV